MQEHIKTIFRIISDVELESAIEIFSLHQVSEI